MRQEVKLDKTKEEENKNRAVGGSQRALKSEQSGSLICKAFSTPVSVSQKFCFFIVM